MSAMTPREIVHELNKHIVGQEEAKRSVAIALRNRWRRMQLDSGLREEITPKNILMIGPTGVLWIIAQQIAQENNLDTSIVMKQIQSQNPDAFINKDADQLKADAKLILPSYDVIPSQKNLEAAIDAQRQYIRRANTAAMQKTAQRPFKRPSISMQAAKRPEKVTTTKTQTLSKAQFSVLAPGRDGNADGTQAKAASNTGNGLSTDILETLKASRQQAASQAQRLSSTSSTLSSYTKKIQLQNQKLAELQARLEKLRNQ